MQNLIQECIWRCKVSFFFLLYSANQARRDKVWFPPNSAQTPSEICLCTSWPFYWIYWFIDLSIYWFCHTFRKKWTVNPHLLCTVSLQDVGHGQPQLPFFCCCKQRLKLYHRFLSLLIINSQKPVNKFTYCLPLLISPFSGFLGIKFSMPSFLIIYPKNFNPQFGGKL